MVWLLLALVPPLLGALAAACLAPKNRGKKRPPVSFVVRYPTSVRASAGVTMLLMLAVLALTVAFGGDTVQQYVLFYLVYAVCIGLALALVVHLSTWYLEVDGDVLLVHTRKGKPQRVHASDIATLDVQKTDVRVCAADGKELFRVGIQLENLDLFFAWTHAHPNIRVKAPGATPAKK